MEQYIIETMRPEWIGVLDWAIWLISVVAFAAIFAKYGKEAWDSFKF